MNLKLQAKALFKRRPFNWLLIGWQAIAQSERTRIRPGTDAHKQQQRTRQWIKDDGDVKLRFNYKLNAASLVMDIGGYNGDFASAIFGKYNCTVYSFEPVPTLYNIINERFLYNDKVKVFPFGLAAETSVQDISLTDNASSIFIKNENAIPIQLKSIEEFLKEEALESVDLVKINIEGGEYELLECMIENKLITKFKNIQVQFHDFLVPDASIKMKAIQQKLALTHFTTYAYEFVWENWQLKDALKISGEN